MMACHPRLTLGIPTLGRRPELLHRAIGSALAQSTPVKVLVSDQCQDGTVERLLKPYEANPMVRRVPSPATCLWENWTFAAEMCDTELFGWLQDDDIIAPHFAIRAIGALDRFPKAVNWIARLAIGYTGDVANWWQATGPMVPMDLLYGTPTQIFGRLAQAVGFFTSFALSPGLVFRWNVETIAAVNRCPKDCDLFNERIILAELGKLGHCACDPCIVGYWNQHGQNESKRQIENGDVPRQVRLNNEHIAGVLRESPGWQEAFGGWVLMVGKESTDKWIKDMEEFPADDIPEWVEVRNILREIGAANRKVEAIETPAPVEHAVNRNARRARKAVRAR
jgi:hypothetical protein